MEILEQITMVFVVFALLGGMLWVLRRKGMASFRLPRRGSSGRRQLEIIERLPLTPSHSIHLVRFADRTLLIGVAPGGCTLLERSEAADAASFPYRKSIS